MTAELAAVVREVQQPAAEPAVRDVAVPRRALRTEFDHGQGSSPGVGDCDGDEVEPWDESFKVLIALARAEALTRLASDGEWECDGCGDDICLGEHVFVSEGLSYCVGCVTDACAVADEDG
eukprot:NODE_2988_length_847_cov_289.550505.p2 GENE.NODE_2988_length_847_cov_289.550505~~NODE_2988_length_847_cov_289.550505.p2  ORF type:complete len:121 (-),score=27.68 NODE_2988_length_847_cov_289.550505:325-687(-)